MSSLVSIVIENFLPATACFVGFIVLVIYGFTNEAYTLLGAGVLLQIVYLLVKYKPWQS